LGILIELVDQSLHVLPAIGVTLYVLSLTMTLIPSRLIVTTILSLNVVRSLMLTFDEYFELIQEAQVVLAICSPQLVLLLLDIEVPTLPVVPCDILGFDELVPLHG